MSDSVDRVFSHALNTVNKIRTGSQKPPSATRLRLYGLYKQAMEGDVDGIMERPEGNGDIEQRAREKWDAWKQQNSLSRTEAKRRYITTLIETMHKYASPSPDSRELVAELEFVWDQVKSNVPSSSSSSPLQTLSQTGMHMPQNYGSQLGQSGRAAMAQGSDIGGKANDGDIDDQPLRVKSPMSQSEEDLEEEEAEIEREEFVDAPDSQYNPNAEDVGVQTDLQNLRRQQPIPMGTPTPAPRMRSIVPQPIPMPAFTSIPATKAAATAPQHESAADQKWRKRVEQALVKMTAEVAALREQLEARRLFSHSPHYRLFRGLWRWAWAAIKHFAVDAFILCIVLLWMRRKKDRRLEGAIRVLLGDAVAQVQRVGGVKLGKVKLPSLGVGGKKST
ncbi:uncharacterized protein K460DRAFT_335227 [Cucurbitaria berberidis CBS 394.84]|uniref:ACB domain-containing protein n=1 Tax=Cucurbitaria berberidis CBS 394.84 TaxID=1168544 RepID=A0A9P4GFF2_9PLEO|nr:uncharacterized protein K460DRAFT_335227 [Cucurbitaria berberidis CBS 394.84]KAF1844486.1 hypothetical protein K460DRAFT_335227 [Cucurbitaria berberidis CBS 394.84]